MYLFGYINIDVLSTSCFRNRSGGFITYLLFVFCSFTNSYKSRYRYMGRIGAGGLKQNSTSSSQWSDWILTEMLSNYDIWKEFWSFLKISVVSFITFPAENTVVVCFWVIIIFFIRWFFSFNSAAINTYICDDDEVIGSNIHYLVSYTIRSYLHMKRINTSNASPCSNSACVLTWEENLPLLLHLKGFKADKCF